MWISDTLTVAIGNSQLRKRLWVCSWKGRRSRCRLHPTWIWRQLTGHVWSYCGKTWISNVPSETNALQGAYDSQRRLTSSSDTCRNAFPSVGAASATCTSCFRATQCAWWGWEGRKHSITRQLKNIINEPRILLAQFSHWCQSLRLPEHSPR